LVHNNGSETSTNSPVVGEKRIRQSRTSVISVSALSVLLCFGTAIAVWLTTKKRCHRTLKVLF